MTALLDVTIARRTDEADDIISLELIPSSGDALPPFEAGAHVDVHVAPGLIRQYSLCGDPRERHRYVLGVLREPGSRGGSRAVHAEFVVGRTVRISPPRNNFALDETASYSILLAAGIGLTPILAMAHRLRSRSAEFELHYCVRTESRAAFRDVLGATGLADRVHLHRDDGPDDQRFRIDDVLSRPAGDRHVYVCGPAGFIDFVTRTAERWGWPGCHVHVERFNAAVETQGATFAVSAARSGIDVTVAADQTIAQALLGAGVPVDLSCEQGVCGTCLTPVLDGVPDHRDSYQTDDEKAANARIAICCSRSKGAHLVLDL